MFDSHKFLKDKFNDADRLIAFIAAYGYQSPSKSAVAKWFLRGTIPGNWLPTLLALLELESGAPVNLVDYLRGPK